MRCPEEYKKQWRLNQGKLRQRKQKRREKEQKAREEGKDKGRTKKEKNHEDVIEGQEIWEEE